MTDDRESPAAGASITALASAAKAAGARPVHLWNPPWCGEIDMRIAADGSWHYMNSPIGRIELVKLFASVLRRDEEGYVLVTPVEKVGIRVDDAPFVAVELDVSRHNGLQVLAFRTNVDDWTVAGPEHALRFETGAAEGQKPYVHVRAGLWALVSRRLNVELAEIGEVRPVDGVDHFGVTSHDVFFPMMPAAELEQRS